MQYARIVALIDAELARLFEVRQLLNYKQAPPKAAKTKSTPMQEPDAAPVEKPRPGRKRANAAPQLVLGLEPVLATQALSPTIEAVAMAEHVSYLDAMADAPQPLTPELALIPMAEEKAGPIPQRLKGTRRGQLRDRRPAAKAIARPNRAGADTPLSALSGQVPAGPVFVPAEQIRLAQAQRDQAQATEQNAEQREAAAPLTAEKLAQKWMLRSNW